MASAYNNIEVKFFSNQEIDDTYNKELIVYPILAYKIYAPIIDDLKLNIFQKYILSILNKGSFSLDEISKWLNLDLLLVKTIAVELINKELIDNEFIITNKGKELINGSFSWFKNIDHLRKDIRYIFQDVFTHKLYPIVLAFNNFQEDVYLKNNNLHIHSKGKKDSFPFQLIEPKKNLNSIRQPETSKVLEVLAEHAKRYLPNSINDIKDTPNAIKFLDNEPELMYCAFWVYAKKGSNNKEEIEVSDPFNITKETFWLRNSLLSIIDNPKVDKTLDSLLYQLEDKDREQVSEHLKSISKEVERNINETFDFTLKTKYHSIYKAINEYYFDFELYTLHKEAHYLKNTFRKSQIVLETLLKEVLNKHKDYCDERISIQTNNGSRFQLYRDELITKIKKINSNIKLPKWHHPEFKGVFNALKNPDKASLRALYVAVILIAYYNHNVSFYQILKEKNDLLIDIENVAESRNNVGHKYVDIPDEKIDEYHKDALIMKKNIEEIIKLFLQNN